jgi:hypothetical protein
MLYEKQLLSKKDVTRLKYFFDIIRSVHDFNQYRIQQELDDVRLLANGIVRKITETNSYSIIFCIDPIIDIIRTIYNNILQINTDIYLEDIQFLDLSTSLDYIDNGIKNIVTPERFRKTKLLKYSDNFCLVPLNIESIYYTSDNKNISKCVVNPGDFLFFQQEAFFCKNMTYYPIFLVMFYNKVRNKINMTRLLKNDNTDIKKNNLNLHNKLSNVPISHSLKDIDDIIQKIEEA